MNCVHFIASLKCVITNTGNIFRDFDSSGFSKLFSTEISKVTTTVKCISLDFLQLGSWLYIYTFKVTATIKSISINFCNTSGDVYLFHCLCKTERIGSEYCYRISCSIYCAIIRYLNCAAASSIILNGNTTIVQCEREITCLVCCCC